MNLLIRRTSYFYQGSRVPAGRVKAGVHLFELKSTTLSRSNSRYCHTVHSPVTKPSASTPAATAATPPLPVVTTVPSATASFIVSVPQPPSGS